MEADAYEETGAQIHDPKTEPHSEDGLHEPKFQY